MRSYKESGVPNRMTSLKVDNVMLVENLLAQKRIAITEWV